MTTLKQMEKELEEMLKQPEPDYCPDFLKKIEIMLAGIDIPKTRKNPTKDTKK